MKTKKIDINKLNPAAYNPRRDLQPDDPEYQKIKKSIDTFGYVQPILWNERTGNIISGHQRKKVLEDAGVQKVDCIVVDFDKKKEKLANIAMNKIDGKWDYPMLSDLMVELDAQNVDLEITGFDADELEDFIVGYNDDPGSEGEGSGEGEDVCFDIIVECNSEAEQKKLMKKFKKDGLECRKG